MSIWGKIRKNWDKIRLASLIQARLSFLQFTEYEDDVEIEYSYEEIRNLDCLCFLFVVRDFLFLYLFIRVIYVIKGVNLFRKHGITYDS